MKDDQTSHSEIVDGVLAALHAARIPDGPSPEVLSAVLEAGSASGDQPQPMVFHGRRARAIRLTKIAAAVLVAVGACIGICSYLTSASDGGSAYADVLAAVKQMEEAKTVTWKTTFYHIRLTEEAEATRIFGLRDYTETREYAYKAPGLYRNVSLDDNGQVRSIDINDTVHRKRLLLVPREKRATLFHLREPMFDPRGPFAGALETIRKEKDLQWLGKKRIAGREANGFRHSFWFEPYNAHWSYDFWTDAETKRLVVYQIPGVDILDPDKVYERPTMLHGVSGHIQHSIVFGAELDDSLFSLEVPGGYALEVKRPREITENDVIEYLGILAEYFDNTFPDSPLDWNHGAESDRFAKLERKPRQQRTPAQNRLVEYRQQWFDVPGLGPLHVFVHPEHYPRDQHIVEGSWKYVGKGVRLGDKDRIVCWYRPKGSRNYRVVYGDLSLKDVPPEDLPLKVEP